MTDAEIVDQAVRIKGVERYRYLALEHPDPSVRADYLRLCRSIATGEPIEMPPVGQQARSLAKAAVKFAASGGATVPAEVRAERLAICRGCEWHDADRGRCGKCGCGGLKLQLATERCPLDPPKWAEYHSPPISA